VIRRLLVAMDGTAHAEAAAALAIDWGRRFGPELVGLGIFDELSVSPREAVPLGGTAYKHHRDEVRRAEAHERITRFLAEFRRRCVEAGVRCEVVEEIGRPHEQIVLEAEACDAVVLGREASFQLETPDGPDRTLSQLLRLSPRPIVVVPREPAAGEGILVAYGGGREVMRTLQTFVLLGLAGDEIVDLLTIHPEYAEAERRLRRPALFLAGHGVRSRLQPLASDQAPAEVILQEVRRLRSRLLVMGAHGHHPVRDLFFTSVTRAVLKETPVPVFAGA
jgi:nucleotide-binding universal stress UspA family protein